MKDKGGTASMPQNEHKQMREGKLGQTANLKYGGDFSNPEDLDKSTEGLANYLKKNQMKY